MNKIWKDYKTGFMDFLENFSAPTNFLLLFIGYFIGIGLSRLFALLSNKPLVWPKVNKQAASYWEPYSKDEDSYSQF